MRVCEVVEPLGYLCVSQAPARVAAALARPVNAGCGRAVAGCGAARDRTRACDVAGSGVQDYPGHADRRTARVVRQPVPAPLSVRPPITLRAWLRHLRVRCTLDAAGLWLDAVRHAIGRA